MRNDMAKGCDIKGTSNKRLVPGLRFPEFEKDGEWEEKKLGEIANIINEKCKVKDLKIETYISTENILKDYAGITHCMAGAKPRGDKEMMINNSVPKPSSTDEQQKIAECLSSIDELISLYENKVTLLEQHKKVLMQQLLFPKLPK